MKTLFTLRSGRKGIGSLVIVFVLFSVLSVPAFSQLSGTYALGAGGDYATFTEAFDALHTQGVSGPVVFEVVSGTYTEQLAYQNVPGADEHNTITFRSATGDSSDVTVQYSAPSYSENYVMTLDSAKYVTFRSITFHATGSLNSIVIKFVSPAGHIVFSHCVFKGVYYPYDAYNKVLMYSLKKIDTITLENNYFSEGNKGIYFSGANNDRLLGVEIRNNRFEHVETVVYLGYAESPKIVGNRADQCDKGILINFSEGGQAVISNNILTNIGNAGAIGLNQWTSSDGEEALVCNNMISHRRNQSLQIRSIYLSYADHVKIYNNTVSVFNENSSTSYTDHAIHIENSVGSTIEVVNNILNLPWGGSVLYLLSSGGLKRCDHNNYYTPGLLFAELDDQVCTDLQALRDAGGGDAHSVFAWPGFTDVNDLQVRSAWLDGKGTPLAEVTEDINGDPRDPVHPDIGAEEFTAAEDLRTPLSGIRTIGTDYATLQEAVDDARIKGVSDTLRLQFPDGKYSGQYVINPVPGASSRHPVIIESASGDADKVTIQYSVNSRDNYILKLFGSSFVHIRNLSFWSTELSCTILQMDLMTDSVTVEECSMKGGDPGSSGSSTTPLIYSANIYFHQMVIRNNSFVLGNGIDLASTIPALAPDDLQIQITGNTLTEGFSAVKLTRLSPVIANNTYNSQRYGIQVNDATGSLLIHDNKIRAPYGVGISLFNCDLPFVEPGRIMNNFIIAGNIGSYGDVMYVGNSENIEIYYNSLFMDADLSSGSSNVYAMRLKDDQSLNIRNNIMSTNGDKYAIYVYNSYFDAVDHNCYYTGGPVLGYWNQDCADLSAIRAVSGMNEHSVSGDPGFVSNTDLHATAALLDSAGIPISDITEDIDGDLRDPQFPDIGADEFGAHPFNHPPVAVNDTTDLYNSVRIAVLANDYDPDGDTIHVTGTGTPAEGRIAGVENDTITYEISTPDYTVDSVIYYIRDAAGLEDSAWIFLNIFQDDHPVAEDDYATVMQGGEVTIDLLANDHDPDGDSIYVSGTNSFLQGSFVLTGNRYLDYTAPLHFTGVDSLEYTVKDIHGGLDVARVFITVTEPVAFEQADIPLEQISHGKGLWVDYDMDGDMDILLSGFNDTNWYNNGTSRVILYSNHQNNSFFVKKVFYGVSLDQMDDVAWGDFDNDGDPDLIIAADPVKLFRNDHGQFTEITTVLPGVSHSSVDWGDYDNDGDVDLLLSGTLDDNRNITRIYKNKGQGEGDQWDFIEQDILLKGTCFGSARWGDYDRDGDLDILITGNSYPNTVWLYQNNGDNQFNSVTTGISNIHGYATWCDYNNDGYPDIIIEGRSSEGVVTKIFRNDASDGGRVFTDIHAGLLGQETGSVTCGDYDVDGDADILVTGRTGDNVPETRLYENKGNDRFEEANIAFPGVVFSSGSWADYDNDGRPDILLMGFQFDEVSLNRFTAVFQGKAAGANTPPAAPSHLSATSEGQEVTLSWDAATDAETPSAGLTYNLRVGTTPGGSEVMSAMVRSSDGALLVPRTGNVGSNTSWKLKGLQYNRTYYWSVQAIDPALGSSAFSGEKTFFLSTSPIVETSLSVPGFIKGDADWGDYDNDGDMDLAITGVKEQGAIAIIFRNDGDTLININAGLENLFDGTISWGDYDNDGDLDLLLFGKKNYYLVGKLYRNDGNDHFTDTEADLPLMYRDDVAWGDYDNDGDLDIFINGYDYIERKYVTRILQNNGGAFTDVEFPVEKLNYGSIDLADFDRDGDLDVLLTGFHRGERTYQLTAIFRNDNGVFTQTDNSFPVLAYNSHASAVWGDYDADGYPDILMGGNLLAKIFHNNGNGTFTDIQADLPSVSNAEAAWLDIDSDGDLDAFLAGKNTNPAFYMNDNGTFRKADIYLPLLYSATIAFGDYDQDGGMDLFLCGRESSNGSYVSHIYHNTFEQKNHAPEPPETTTAYNQGDYTVFRWTNGSDPETPETGLTYNLRIGTTPGGSEIMSPMSSAAGRRLVVSEGNAGHNHIWKIRGLEEGATYYWSVQAVDAGFRGSNFSEEMQVRRFTAHSIRGAVYTPLETPVTKARVTAYLVNAQGVSRESFSYYLDGSNGYNIFSFPEGVVIVGVYPDTSEYPGYLPTFYGNTDYYPEAERIMLDEDKTDINIMLVPAPVVMTGTVNAGGTLGMAQGKKSRTVTLTSGEAVEESSAVGDVWVYLFNSDGEIASSDVTDSLGAFSFDNIPTGHYSFYADYMGYAMDAANDSLLLDQEHHTYKIAAYVSDTTISYSISDVTAVDDPRRTAGITVYPNPVEEDLYLRFDRPQERPVTVRVTGMDGSVRKSLHFATVPADAVVVLPAGDLPPGIYILSVEGEKTVYRTRIVKIR